MPDMETPSRDRLTLRRVLLLFPTLVVLVVSIPMSLIMALLAAGIRALSRFLFDRFSDTGLLFAWLPLAFEAIRKARPRGTLPKLWRAIFAWRSGSMPGEVRELMGWEKE